MATASEVSNRKSSVITLDSGDRMNREEFHRVYSQMPEDFRAELVGGIVYVSSPIRHPHGDFVALLGGAFFNYAGSTPGVRASVDVTIILGAESELQPDLHLRILPEFGGRSKPTDEEYLVGAPELVAEVAYSSHSLDLHSKRRDYTSHGGLEYIVASLRERRLHWFDLPNDKEYQRHEDGILRIQHFPGLWIDEDAYWRQDIKGMLATLQRGLDSEEHQQFVDVLAARQKTA